MSSNTADREQELREIIEDECSRSAVRIFDYWLKVADPTRAFELAVLSFTDNREYQRAKRELEPKSRGRETS